MNDFREALIGIPRVLLSTDDEAVRADALVSLDLYEGLDERATVVALVGPSGAGRSWVFNSLTRESISPVGSIRPTTTGLVAAGRQAVVVRDLAVEEMHITHESPDGVVLIDTPAWEHEPAVVRSVVAHSDVVVVVVSPSRYADASVAQLWSEVRDRALLVLNKVDPDPPSLRLLLESVAGIFEYEPVVVKMDQADVHEIEVLLSEYASKDVSPMRAITLAAARAAAGYLARVTARMAIEVQDVSLAVGQEEPFVVPPAVLSVRESWLATKQVMVDAVAREIRERDDRIARRAANALSARLLTDLEGWNDDALDTDLDSWKERCRAMFRDEASIRWRRGPAEHLIDNYSWKIAVNANVVAPRRFHKIMGKRRDDVAAVAHDELVVLLAGSVEERRLRWSESVDVLGAFPPGTLLAFAASVGSESDND